MAAALALGERGQGLTGDNPSVGCIIVRDGIVVGRGWTRSGGRPHAEAIALEQAGVLANGATLYSTLEPCAHVSERGPSCAAIIVEAGVGRVVVAVEDPDPRTAGKGLARIASAGIDTVRGVMASAANASLSGFLMRINHGRPHVTLKLALSRDGAMENPSARWLTGEVARAHTHLERSRCDAILVGSGTVRLDTPRLDVRLDGLEQRSPHRLMLGRGSPPAGWAVIRDPGDIQDLPYNRLMVEGGAATVDAFLSAGLVDRIMIYRAPITVAADVVRMPSLSFDAMGSANTIWQLSDTRSLGNDRLEVYEAARTNIPD